MSKHTEGPWHWVDQDNTVLASLNNGNAILVHQAQWQVSPPDAALIAAAPDLLEACNKALMALSDILGAAEDGDPYGPNELIRMFMIDYNDCHKAIAKAKGE